MHDIVFRGGTVVDGSGAPPRQADVAIEGGIVTAVDPAIGGSARRTIDAGGLLVTPGFVDIHTHYDGQMTWDGLLAPSALHGVTTAVCGNCGVGFAPVRPGWQDWLVGLMEGVEDIPGSALSEGLDWSWESFADFLDVAERRPRAMDVGVLIAHGPVRAYVMGERGAYNGAATEEDVEAMASIVRDAMVRRGAWVFHFENDHPQGGQRRAGARHVGDMGRAGRDHRRAGLSRDRRVRAGDGRVLR